VVLGANGAVYAIRKHLYRPLPTDTLIDDFTIPLQARLHERCRCVYDKDALAHEETARDLTAEFHRRARIGAGGYQAIGRLVGLLDPRQGWYAAAFLGHKVLRWLCPFFLIGALGASVLLAAHPLYKAVLLAQVLGYATVAIPIGVRRRLPLPIRLAAMFTGMNAALLVGFLRWLFGQQSSQWRRTERRLNPESAQTDLRPA
jgi:cellulose synthase/poly-beta-1,6-N-acetylglucosamine synthase-like glycosyltransferase